MTMSRLFPAVLASVWAGLISTQAAGQWAATKIVPQPTHKCDDPVPGGDVMKTIQIADQKDSSPHANGRDGNWYVTRTTKWIPYCMYHDPIGHAEDHRRRGPDLRSAHRRRQPPCGALRRTMSAPALNFCFACNGPFFASAIPETAFRRSPSALLSSALWALLGNKTALHDRLWRRTAPF
jgi:hypothetical protein